MPGIDGLSVIREAKRLKSDLPVIITTAYLSIEPQLKVLDLPHSGYIVKPLKLNSASSQDAFNLMIDLMNMKVTPV
mgnify:CR=1 FL=1